MTKATLGGLTRALARELGPRGISVNLVQPGPIVTDANPESVNIPMWQEGNPKSVAGRRSVPIPERTTRPVI